MSDDEDDDFGDETPATVKIQRKGQPKSEEPELPEGVLKLAVKLAREAVRDQDKVRKQNVALNKVPGRLRALHRVYMPLVFDMWRRIADQLEPSDREFLQEWGFLSKREKKD